MPPSNAAAELPNSIRGVPEVVEALKNNVGPPESPPIVSS